MFLHMHYLVVFASSHQTINIGLHQKLGVGRVVKSADFFTTLNHSIISLLCLVWVSAPACMTSHILLVGVPDFFSLVLLF